MSKRTWVYVEQPPEHVPEAKRSLVSAVVTVASRELGLEPPRVRWYADIRDLADPMMDGEVRRRRIGTTKRSTRSTPSFSHSGS